jgi:hypothetical protein
MKISFRGEIWYWRGPAPFNFISVPPDDCELLHAASSFVTYGWGMIPVQARIGTTEWRTSLWPKDGGYLLPVKAAVRQAEGLAEGDVAQAEITVGV